MVISGDNKLYNNKLSLAIVFNIYWLWVNNDNFKQTYIIVYIDDKLWLIKCKYYKNYLKRKKK